MIGSTLYSLAVCKPSRSFACKDVVEKLAYELQSLSIVETEKNIWSMSFLLFVFNFSLSPSPSHACSSLIHSRIFFLNFLFSFFRLNEFMQSLFSKTRIIPMGNNYLRCHYIYCGYMHDIWFKSWFTRATSHILLWYLSFLWWFLNLKFSTFQPNILNYNWNCIWIIDLALSSLFPSTNGLCSKIKIFSAWCMYMTCGATPNKNGHGSGWVELDVISNPTQFGRVEKFPTYGSCKNQPNLTCKDCIGLGWVV